MDFLAEYAEMTVLPRHIAVTYKFFSLFQIHEGTLLWSHWMAPLTEEQRGACKAFLKAQRVDLREGKLTASECSRRMWFWYQKILEMGLFLDHSARMEMLKWMEVCQLVVS